MCCCESQVAEQKQSGSRTIGKKNVQREWKNFANWVGRNLSPIEKQYNVHVVAAVAIVRELWSLSV